MIGDSLQSALYVGEVVHQRVRTFRHRLRYRLWMVLADLDELDWLQDRLRLLRRRAFGLITLRAADHGDRSGRPLRVQIEGHLAEAGVDIAGGPIRLLTMPRILGYGFNPISVFFCHTPDGALAALLYEVTNTFHERHSYLVAVPGGQTGPLRQTVEKQLFVSPFMDRDLTYDFTVHPPGEGVSVVVAVRRGDTPILTASFAGRRRPLTDGQLLRAFVTHPLLTWKVTCGIHWEAFLGILKGARYRERGAPPPRPVTVGHVRF
ncbi:DUF1365 domain-containing protein [Brevundimonas sp. Root1423]|uniref:DUF1365 domain-containing protein n=1 Tax=Brevundimonas sp. Root1423 TaxID=1736462 RepID=UPI000701AD44|nr:DUF1365 family protein [Brevundimonas sp. Root1423]KQY75501.1 hypothetical protein ASD25_13305 [Brevundimonas sp. Root1423]